MFLIYLRTIENALFDSWAINHTTKFYGVQAQQSPEKILFFGDSIRLDTD